jgi:hypothetical protein
MHAHTHFAKSHGRRRTADWRRLGDDWQGDGLSVGQLLCFLVHGVLYSCTMQSAVVLCICACMCVNVVLCICACMCVNLSVSLCDMCDACLHATAVRVWRCAWRVSIVDGGWYECSFAMRRGCLVSSFWNSSTHQHCLLTWHANVCKTTCAVMDVTCRMRACVCMRAQESTRVHTHAVLALT